MVAIGIVRQSRGREESLSPIEQRGRIAALCEREGLTLSTVHEEIDVSGGTPLARREGLRAAVEAIEGGSAQVVVVAYFDRLFRSLSVQAEVVERVEKAGGRILAADVGEVGASTAGQWISSAVLGVVSEYYRRSIRERSGAAQALAVAEGRPPFGSFPPGYVRGREGNLTVAEVEARAVRQAFQLRVEGATIKEVRAFLREQGIERSYHGVQSLLRSRIYLGEIRFGALFNPAAHEPLIDRATFDAVQTAKRGPRPKSDRLLARLGVLRCGNCGARMNTGTQTQNGRRYAFYRCPPVGDCSRRVTIGANIVEGFVVDAVKRELAHLQGRASVEEDARGAEEALVVAQQNLDSAIRAFAELTDEPAAVERLRELRAVRDGAREHVDRLSSLRAALVVTVEDWDSFTLEGRRGLVASVVEAVFVFPGKGVGRLQLLMKDAAGLAVEDALG